MKKIKNDKERFVVSVKVGEKGQIIVPKEAREMFNINPGDTLMFLGDINRGMALLRADGIYELVEKGIIK